MPDRDIYIGRKRFRINDNDSELYSPNIQDVKTYSNNFKFKKMILKKTSKIIYSIFKRDLNYSLSNLTEILGFEFQSFPYTNRFITNTNLMKIVDLLKHKFGNNILFNLFGIDEIPIEEMVSNYSKRIFLHFDRKISEFFCILLGDGHLNKKGDVVKVSLNSVDDPHYFSYVQKMISDIFPKFNCTVVDYSDSKSSDLMLNNKAVHIALVEIGFISGNKVSNKVFVPHEIISNLDFIPKGLKGLFDTDGSIFIISESKTLIVSFTNASYNLVSDFRLMCNKLSIKTSSINPYSFSNPSGTISNAWTVRVSSKKNVRDFINLVDPEKLREPYRITYFGLQIMLWELPEHIQNMVNDRLITAFPNESDRKYTKDFVFFFRSVMENYYNKVDLELSLKQILDYLLPYSQFPYIIDNARLLKLLYEQFGSFIRIRNFLVDVDCDLQFYEDFLAQQNFSIFHSFIQDLNFFSIPTVHTIPDHIRKYIRENTNLDYNGWISKYQIKDIQKNSDNIIKISSNLRNLCCNLIFRELLNLVDISPDSIINELSFNNLLFYWLFNKKTNILIPFRNYFRDLIHFLKLILNSYQNKSLSQTELIKNSRFSHYRASSIISYLHSSFPRFFK